MAATPRKRSTPLKTEERKEIERSILQMNREIRKIGNSPIERHDPNPLKLAQVRAEAYYNICERYGQKPTWEGLALALGMDRHVLGKWRERQVNWVVEAGIADFLTREWAFLCSCHVSAMEAGTMDKITGIFLARNNFNYVNEDPKVQTHEVNIHFTADQLIEEAKNLQLTDKPIDVEYEVKEEPPRKPDPTYDLDLDDPDDLILE